MSLLHYMTLHSKYNYATSHTHTRYTRLHCTILDYVSLHYTMLPDYTTLQPHLHYTTTTATTALHHTTSSSCGWGDRCNHCNHSKKHNSNHLLVHQWTRSAIRDSQQLTSPVGFLFLKLPPPPCAVLLVIVIIHNLSLGTLASAIPERQYLDAGRDKLRCCSYILRCRRQVCI